MTSQELACDWLTFVDSRLLTIWVPLYSYVDIVLNKKKKKFRSLVSETSSCNLNDSRCTINASLSDDQNITPLQSSSTSECTPTTIQNSVHKRPVMTDSLDATLGGLKISTPVKSGLDNQSNMPFSPKMLFSDKPGYNPKLNDSYCSQQSVTSPSRLSTKNITQSSWVAGGYWGHPVSPSRDMTNNVMPDLRHQSHPSCTHFLDLQPEFRIYISEQWANIIQKL